MTERDDDPKGPDGDHDHPEAHHHGDHHHHGDGHHPGHEGDGPLDVAVLAITSTRDGEGDVSGTVARSRLEAAGHTVTDVAVVADDVAAIREHVRACEADALVSSGGTGLTPDDVTVEAVTPLFDREIPGFGEYFRRLSHRDVGTPAMLSRATAGVVDGTVVYALPGNPDAVELGVDACVLPELEHTVSLVQRS